LVVIGVTVFKATISDEAETVFNSSRKQMTELGLATGVDWSAVGGVSDNDDVSWWNVHSICGHGLPDDSVSNSNVVVSVGYFTASVSHDTTSCNGVQRSFEKLNSKNLFTYSKNLKHKPASKWLLKSALQR
jgi:hypothetical protein